MTKNFNLNDIYMIDEINSSFNNNLIALKIKIFYYS